MKDNPFFSMQKFSCDKIRAIDARFEAQKIAFAPLAFQAVRAMKNLGVLNLIEDSGDGGISQKEISEKLKISEYGISVLCEMALAMGVVKFSQSDFQGEEKFVLGKIGWFLLNDDLTRANFDFCSDICYKGAEKLQDSVASGKPEGLKVFGKNWTTIYEALSSLPEREKKSWFSFDHFYSDAAFPDALPIVFEKKPKTIVDIGGNTAKWAVACCKYDSEVQMTIVDLPGQTAVAEKNAASAGFSGRIKTLSGNILDSATALPPAPDAFWMSQFLDCFSLRQVTKILKKIYAAATEKTLVYVLEPLWDKQQYEGNAYSVIATSLYFTCIANGNSKMYRSRELIFAIEEAGFSLNAEHDNLGAHAYSLLVFKKK